MTFLEHDDLQKPISSDEFQNIRLHTDAKRWGFIKKLLYTFAWLTLPRTFHKLFNIEVNGLENLKKFPEGTPLLLCGNHKSHLDSIIVGTTVANMKFRIRKFVGFMVNGKAFNTNFFTRQLKFLGAFPVFKDKPEPAFQYTIETLKANLAVVIFPQGGRVSRASVLSDYRHILTDGRTGVGRIILRLNGKVPVVPFYIHGSEKALRIGSFMPKWGTKISITFGEPIFFYNYFKNNGWDTKSEDFYDSARLIVNNIMKSVWNLLKQVESSFLELLEQELGPLDSIDENTYQTQINKILSKIKDNEIYKFIYKK